MLIDLQMSMPVEIYRKIGQIYNGNKLPHYTEIYVILHGNHFCQGTASLQSHMWAQCLLSIGLPPKVYVYLFIYKNTFKNNLTQFTYYFVMSYTFEYYIFMKPDIAMFTSHSP